MGENNEGRPNFSSLNPPIILHRPSSASCTMDSPDHPSGISTPPLQTSASVPFKWEQEPGKPRPDGTQIATRPEPDKCLDPPPCRMQFIAANIKTPSPSIIDGPYSVGQPRFFSFRFFRDGGQDSSFETSYSSSSNRRSSTSTRHQPAGTPNYNVDTLLGAGGKKSSTRGRGFFGKFKDGSNREVDGISFGFSSSSTSTSSSCDSDEISCRRMEINGGGGRKMRRQASFPTVPHAHTRSSHIWATIYEGLKHVIQWKSSSKKRT